MRCGDRPGNNLEAAVTDRKRYARIPKAVHPYLPNFYAILKDLDIEQSPYDIIAEAFGASRSRIEQIVVAERRKAKDAERADAKRRGDQAVADLAAEINPPHAEEEVKVERTFQTNPLRRRHPSA